MAYCPTCGQEVGETQRFCANCGTKLMGAHAAVPDPRGPVGGGVVEGEGFHWNAGAQADPGLGEEPEPVDAELEPDDFFASYRRKGFEGDDDVPPLPRRSRRRFDPDLSYPDEGPDYSEGGAEEAYRESDGLGPEPYRDEPADESGAGYDHEFADDEAQHPYPEESYAEESYAEESYAEESYVEESYARDAGAFSGDSSGFEGDGFREDADRDPEAFEDPGGVEPEAYDAPTGVLDRAPSPFAKPSGRGAASAPPAPAAAPPPAPAPFAGPPARYAGPPAARPPRPPQRPPAQPREQPERPRAFDDVLHGETPTGTVTDVGDKLIRSRDFDQTGIVPVSGGPAAPPQAPPAAAPPAQPPQQARPPRSAPVQPPQRPQPQAGAADDHGPVDQRSWEQQLEASRARALAERAAAASGVRPQEAEEQWGDDEDAATQLFFLPSSERARQAPPARPAPPAAAPPRSNVPPPQAPAPRPAPAPPQAPPPPARPAAPVGGAGFGLQDLGLEDELDEGLPPEAEQAGVDDWFAEHEEPRTAAMPAPAAAPRGAPRPAPRPASRPAADRPAPGPVRGGAAGPGGPAGPSGGRSRLDDTSRRRLLTIVIAVCGAVLLLVSSLIISNSLRTRGGDPSSSAPSASEQNPPAEQSEEPVPEEEAGPPPAVLDPSFETTRFENESGNLRCIVSPEYGVVCQHSNPSHAVPEQVCGQAGANGSVVGLDSHGYGFPCMTQDIVRGLPKLDFDTPLQLGEFTCSINYQTGVTCMNAAGDSISLENSVGVTTQGRQSTTPQPTFDPQAL